MSSGIRFDRLFGESCQFDPVALLEQKFASLYPGGAAERDNHTGSGHFTVFRYLRLAGPA